jgi:hypothetical protein
MTEQVIVRDIDNKNTEGYMKISQHLGTIRSLCLPGTQPQNLSAEEMFTKIDGLLKEIERTVSRFEQTFSVKERGSISAYVHQVKSKIKNNTKHEHDTLSTMLEEIYHCSTELRASLVVFRITIPLECILGH